MTRMYGCRMACVTGWLASAGCLQFEPPPVAASSAEVVEVAPETVGPEEAIRVRFAAPLPEGLDPAVLGVRDEAGAEVPAAVQWVDEAQLALTPSPRWPSGAALRVSIAGEATEHWVSVSAEALGTETSTQVTLRGPAALPPNARWLLLEGVGEGETPALAGRGPPLALEVEAWADGRALARVPAAGVCAGLCAGQTYRVGSSAVRTGTVADRQPPTVTGLDVQLRGDLAFVHVHADEPVVVRGQLSGAGVSVPLGVPARLADRVVVEAAAAVPRGATLWLALTVEDLAGHRVEVPEREVTVPPRPRVRIVEVVAKPLRDWSDSEGGAVPFDRHPGVGAVNDNDEWVELVNDGDAPIDLLAVGLALHAVDTSPSVTFVDGAPGLYFGAGGHLREWRPGEALVVRPRGNLSQRALTLTLLSGRERVDEVVLGDQPGAVHRNGSPPDAWRESIALGPEGRWLWCVPNPGDPRPPSGCGP